MSIGTDYNSPYRKMVNEKNRLIDATIKPVNVTPNPKGAKLCPNCHRAMMEPYLQPPSRFVDENGVDNNGFKPNQWYWRCSLLQCNHRELMPVTPEPNKKGYRTKNTTLNKLPMWLGEPGSPGRRRRSRNPTGINSSEVDRDDAKQLADYLGYTPQSIEYRDSA